MSGSVASSPLLLCVPTLTVEDVTANPFPHGHTQVDIEANAGDADAGIVLVLGQQESIVVVVVMVRVAGMPMAVYEARHSSGNVSCAVRGRAPVKWARGYLRVVRAALRLRQIPLCLCPGLQDAQLWAENARVGWVGRRAIQPVRLR